MSTLPSIERIAELLGGEVSNGNQVRAPGPGHSPQDRSLSIKIDPAAPDGFLVTSFAGDDAIACKDYVRQKLGLPAFEPKKSKTKSSSAWAFIGEHVYRTADGKLFLRVQKYRDEAGKKQYPQSHWDGQQWVKGKPKAPKVPYRLPELLAAPITTSVYICEGEKDCDNLANIGFVATCNSEGAAGTDKGASKKWPPELNQHFKDRHVYILPDNDVPGRKHAQHVARNLDPVAASVRVVELPRLSSGEDVSDWLEHDPTGAQLARECKAASVWDPAQSPGEAGDERDRKRIAELAVLDRLGYAKRRRAAAERMEISVAELDKIVAEARSQTDEAALYEHWTVACWSEPVAGDELIQELIDLLGRYVVMTNEQALVAGLWILFTWLHEAVAVHSPLLLITSPEANSGKSTLLGVISFLARCALPSVSISGPALFRSLEKWQPTFVIDEADHALVGNEDLREVINSGWTRGQCVIRCDPVSHEPRPFSTFAPKAVGMKGTKLPDTTLSRTIIVRLTRKRPTEVAADFNHLDSADLSQLRQRIARWTQDNSLAVARAEPENPVGFYNRIRANWRPLLAIAAVIGGDYPALAKKAAGVIEQVRDTLDHSTKEELLADIEAIFAKLGPEVDRLFSKRLIAELVADETKPWATFNKGKPISERQLARLLREHNIHPKGMRDKDDRARGYLRDDFKDAFDRYLPRGVIPSVTSVTSNNLNDLEAKRSVTPENAVTDKNSEKQSDINNVTDVTDKKAPLGEGVICEGDDCRQGNGPLGGGDAAPGLSRRAVEGLARDIENWAYERTHATGPDASEEDANPVAMDIDQDEIEDEIRRRLDALGVFPDGVEVEVERVVECLFEARR